MNHSDFERPDISRRDFLRRAIAAGLIVIPGSGALGACAFSGGGGGNQKSFKGKVTEKNPLGVDPEAPLDVVIFKGGYGDEYAKFDEQLYKERYPEAKIKHQGIQQIRQVLQPRFVAGNPPDVIDNSGAQQMDTAGLVADRQLENLADLLKAPAIGFGGKTVEETLLPGVVELGSYNDKFHVLNYVYTVNSFWYSSSLFEERGWSYPKTWDEMLDLCAEIQDSGMAPWTYQGKYPGYFVGPILQMAAKAGGVEVLYAIDNLEPNAWKQPAVQQAAEAVYQLVDRGYILEGTAGLDHIQSQTAWVRGKAVFIPCGSWLENEMKSLTPDGFDMVVQPTPSLSSSDALPFEATHAYPGEPFIVPSQGKNVRGGLEFMRIMLSSEATRKFAELTRSLTCVEGAAEGLELGTAFASAREAVAAAGGNTFTSQYGGWYAKMAESIDDNTGAMLRNEIGPDEWMNRCQQAADQTAQDDSIKKYKRQA